MSTPTRAGATWELVAAGVYSDGTYTISHVKARWEVRVAETSALLHLRCPSLKFAKSFVERHVAGLTARQCQEANTRAERNARLAELCTDWTHKHVTLDANRLLLLLKACALVETFATFLRGVHCMWPECDERCSGESCSDECPDRRWPETCPSGCETHECCDSPRCLHDRAVTLAEHVEYLALTAGRVRPVHCAA